MSCFKGKKYDIHIIRGYTNATIAACNNKTVRDTIETANFDSEQSVGHYIGLHIVRRSMSQI